MKKGSRVSKNSVHGFLKQVHLFEEDNYELRKRKKKGQEKGKKEKRKKRKEKWIKNVYVSATNEVVGLVGRRLLLTSDARFESYLAQSFCSFPYSK